MQIISLITYKPLTNTSTYLDNAKYFRIFAFRKFVHNQFIIINEFKLNI